MFLSLPTAELALARVAERVRQGGHDVRADVVRRRFTAGLRNFSLSAPRLIARRMSDGEPGILEAVAWSALEERGR